MKQIRQIGVCLDHSSAYLIEPAGKEFITNVITSDFNHHDKNSISRNENLMHNKEQDHLQTYYKKITEVISQYDEIILFGQTEAKKELLNLLKINKDFEPKSIKAIDTDKMTDNQKKAFVKEYFSKEN